MTGDQDEIISPSASASLTEVDPYLHIKTLISLLSEINESSLPNPQFLIESFEAANSSIAVLALEDLSLLPLLSELLKVDIAYIMNSSVRRNSLIKKLSSILPKANTEIKAQLLRPSSITISAINKLNSSK